MVSPQMFARAGIVLIAAASCCLFRIIYLGLAKSYPAFILFLVSQIATAVFTQVAGTGSAAYAYAYLFLVLLEWMAYGWMLRELYTAIFSSFKGIASLGTWSIYGAFFATLLIVATGMISARDKAQELRTLLVAVEFASRCLLFGYAALIIFILVVITKYPIALRKNILVISIVFSVILLSETSALIVEQLTSRRYTGVLNGGVSILGSFCMLLWTFSLSLPGETVTIEPPGPAGDEARLLRQLGTLNSILLRFAKKLS